MGRRSATYTLIYRRSIIPSYIFQLLNKGARKLWGVNLRLKEREAREWFRTMLRAVTRKVATAVPYADPQKMIDSAGAFERVVRLSENSIGKMYIFSYDAKLKATLPYWDRFPCVFVIDVQPTKAKEPAILALNLHYLNPMMRAQLMDRLYTTMTNTKMDETTKLKINYGILKAASQFKAFRPCLKMYLLSHVETAFVSISPRHWDFTLLLTHGSIPERVGHRSLDAIKHDRGRHFETSDEPTSKTG